METSEHVGELFAALSKAQGAIKGAIKDSVNPYYKSKYADLAAVWDVCREPLSANELCVIQCPSSVGASVTVITTLGHSSGQWVRESLTLVAKDDTPQSVGSASTYARRYGLSAMAGIAPEDDDGEAAQPRASQMAPVGQRRPTAPAAIDGKGKSLEPPPLSDSDAPPTLNRAGKRVDAKPAADPLSGDSIPF